MVFRTLCVLNFVSLSNICLSDSEVYFPFLTGDNTVGLNDLMDALSYIKGELRAMMKRCYK